MKKYIFLLLPLLPHFASAQSETAIKQHYQEINKQITESIEHGYEGSLYNNQWVVNKNSKSWPAVGNYNETVNFWYDDDPNHLPTSERDPKTVLLKVMITRKASHLLTNEEFLYQKGKLVFYYLHEAEEGNEWETRIYFNEKGMFKSQVKANGKELSKADFSTTEYKDFEPKPPGVLKHAKKYQEMFTRQMSD